MPGARTQSKLPIEIVAGNRQPSSHVCTQPQTHAYRSGFKPGTNVGAGCSCHPTGYTIIARLAFLYILSGQGQLHACRHLCATGDVTLIEIPRAMAESRFFAEDSSVY
jgi:hypothetical protein